MRLTIVGCGSIGTKLAKAADGMQEVRSIYLIDSEPERAEKLASELRNAKVVDSVEDELYHCDLVVEAASQSAAADILPKVVARGVDIMVLSVGALVDDGFRSAVFQKAKENESRILIPSGAVSGTDGLRSASMDELSSVELVTTKNPKSMKDIPYLREKGIIFKDLTGPTEVFRGTAREAVRLFPKNINVAATVSLLGIGFDRTVVTIVLDPKILSNSHELRIKGAFGEMNCHTWNVPSPDNPRTSHLAALSAISVLKRVVRNEWIGI